MNDYLKFCEIRHSEPKQNSWRPPKVQTGDGSLYKIDYNRTLTDDDSKLEYEEYLKKKTNTSIKNAREYFKKQSAIVFKESEQFVILRLSEIKKLKTNPKFLEECFKAMDGYPDSNKSYDTMRMIIFNGWRSLSDKYSSDSLKKLSRQLEKDNRTYAWNLGVVTTDIVGLDIQHSYCDEPRYEQSYNTYKYNVRDSIDAKMFFPYIDDYKRDDEVEISDEIAKLYEQDRGIKLPLKG